LKNGLVKQKGDLLCATLLNNVIIALICTVRNLFAVSLRGRPRYNLGIYPSGKNGGEEV